MVGCSYLNQRNFSYGLKPMCSVRFARSTSVRRGKSFGGSEVWIDGPRATKLNQSVKIPITSVVNMNEIWVDGPNSLLNESKDMPPQYQSKFTLNLKRTSLHLDSLECLDRQLLNRLNEHERDLHINLQKFDSRPISLLSETSTNHEEPSLHQKLQGLKSGYGQMIFKKPCKEMESLHKTLESFLNSELNLDQKYELATSPVPSSALLTSTRYLLDFDGNKSDAILSSPGISHTDSSSADSNPYSEPFDSLNPSTSNNVKQIYDGQIPNLLMVKGKLPGIKGRDTENSSNSSQNIRNQRRLCYNFSSNSPEQFFAEIFASDSNSSVHNPQSTVSISAPTSETTPLTLRHKYCDNRQPVLRIIRQTAKKLSGVAGCGSRANDASTCTDTLLADDKPVSILGRILKRKDKKPNRARRIERRDDFIQKFF